jgi:hypothetical protein
LSAMIAALPSVDLDVKGRDLILRETSIYCGVPGQLAA